VIELVPRKIVAPFVGFPEQHLAELAEIIDPLVGWDPDGPPAPPQDYSARMAALMDAMLEEKRRAPGDDVLSAIVAAEGGEDGLTREESAIAARGFGFAAFDTTVNLLANGAAVLAAHPDVRAQLTADPSLIPNAIEEMLRFESPTQNEPRLALEALEIHGTEIPAGDQILLMLGSANRDERKWDAPDHFDVTRPCRDHLAFGLGLHLCIGQHVARLEARIFFEELLLRMPNYQVGASVHYVSAWARALYTLPITW
jgi:cytochrome P450